MHTHLLTEVNWLAVVLAALAYFVIGALWYSPLVFGRIWTSAAGIDMTGEGPPPTIYLIPLVGSLLSSIALAMIAVGTRTDTLREGIVLGLVVGIGFAVSISAVTATFETNKPKPMVWAAVNAGYHLTGNVAAGIIIAVMR